MQDMLSVLIPLIVAHAVVLVVIVVVIRRLLLGDTMTAIARIRQVEAEVRKKEESVRKSIEEHEKEFEKRKAEAEVELQRRREAADQETAKVRERVLAEARQEGEQIVAQAKKNEQKMREQIAREMEAHSVEHGAKVFQLVFSERMTGELDKAFTMELLDAIAEVDAGNITVDTDQAEITASRPLEPEVRKRIETLLAEKFGIQIGINEKTDPALLGGLILKLGSLEIDGSLLNRFREAAEEVKKAVAG